MKRALSYLLIAALAFIVPIFSFSACDSDSASYTVYYKNADGDKLLSEKRKMENGKTATKEETVEFLIDELTKSPKTDGGINVLPNGTILLDVTITGKTATVNISDDYYLNRDVDELLARVAIVNTLCGIDGISNVRIKIEGKALVSTMTGTEIGLLRRSDIAAGPQDAAVTEKETVVIYFPDKNGEYLVAESREIEVQASLSVEKLIISELAKGPENKELVQVIPSETKVISTETKDGVCFVNLSGDFADKITAGSTSTTMALYSIVNSLTELDGISSVQLLIDGKTGAEFGNYVLDVPFQRNEALIKE